MYVDRGLLGKPLSPLPHVLLFCCILLPKLLLGAGAFHNNRSFSVSLHG